VAFAAGSSAASPPGSPFQPSSCQMQLWRPALRQSLQIQDPADQVRLLLHMPPASTSEAAQPVPVLAFTEQFLDQLPTALRELVGCAARPHAHPRVRQGAATRLDGDVRFDASGEQRVDEVLVEEPLVGTEGRRSEAQAAACPIEQRETAVFL